MRRRGTGPDFELRARIAFVLVLLLGTAAAAAYGLASLYFIWPAYWPLWTFIVVLLLVGLGAQYGAGQRALLRAVDARIVTREHAPTLTRLLAGIAAMADMPPPQRSLGLLFAERLRVRLEHQSFRRRAHAWPA